MISVSFAEDIPSQKLMSTVPLEGSAEGEQLVPAEAGEAAMAEARETTAREVAATATHIPALTVRCRCIR